MTFAHSNVRIWGFVIFLTSPVRPWHLMPARFAFAPSGALRCEGESGSAVEPGLEDGEEKGQGPAFMDRREDCLRQVVVRPRRAGDGWPDGNRDEAQRLAIMVSAVDRSSLSSRTAGEVMPSRSGMAAPMSGEASQRWSSSATALTPRVHVRRAVHRGKANCRTMSAATFVGAPSPSSSRWSWTSAPTGARAVNGRDVAALATAA